MTQRDRLIELIQSAVDGCARHWAEVIADKLLANGVIVPPVKVGDTVYEHEYSVCDTDVGGFWTEEVVPTQVRGIAVLTEYDYHTLDNFGKTVFLTREEAEAALEEGSKGDA